MVANRTTNLLKILFFYANEFGNQWIMWKLYVLSLATLFLAVFVSLKG